MSYIYKLSDDVAPSLREIFEEREWIEWNHNMHDDNEWNILWTTKRYLTKSSSYSLNTFQKLNHFNRTSQMTKKDNLTRNLKRMRANFGKIYSFYPKSYQFPLQYSEFVAMTQKRKNKNTKNISTSYNGRIQLSSIHKELNHKRNLIQNNTCNKPAIPDNSTKPNTIDTSSIWIAKPACGRRGENISLFTDVSKLNYSQPMIIQRYISNPLLIGGYKFDLRIYVLITSFRPLKIYCYNDGLCRFSTQQYDLSNLSNVYSHLTNSSINKTSDTLNKNKLIIGEGCKWTMNKLFKYLQSEVDNQQNLKSMENDGVEQEKKAEMKRINIRNKIWNKIHDIIILTVLPIIMDVEQSANCFELFGFDILIDENYNCWLLEVNGSPAIAIQTEVDRMVKYPMLNDLIDCIQNEFGFIIPNRKYKQRSKSSSGSSEGSMKRSRSLHSKVPLNEIEDLLLNQVESVDLSGCMESQCDESELKSMETMESQKVNLNDDETEEDLFRDNVGGFIQIFPFNANTLESNKKLTNLSKPFISRAQKFKTTVVKEIKRRRYQSKQTK